MSEDYPFKHTRYFLSTREQTDMDVKYFDDTDTLLVVFSNRPVVATEDVNEQMIVDLDEAGNPVALTIEHARTFVNINTFSFQHVTADQNRTATLA